MLSYFFSIFEKDGGKKRKIQSQAREVFIPTIDNAPPQNWKAQLEQELRRPTYTEPEGGALKTQKLQGSPRQPLADLNTSSS